MTTETIAALEGELAKAEARAGALREAIAVLRDDLPRPVKRRRSAKPDASPRRRGMRKAKYGKRQDIVLDAYRGMTTPTPLAEFVSTFSTSGRQRRLFKATISRLAGLGRVAMQNGVLLPEVAQ